MLTGASAGKAASGGRSGESLQSEARRSGQDIRYKRGLFQPKTTLVSSKDAKRRRVFPKKKRADAENSRLGEKLEFEKKKYSKRVPSPGTRRRPVLKKESLLSAMIKSDLTQKGD